MADAVTVLNVTSFVLPNANPPSLLNWALLVIDPPDDAYEAVPNK